MASPSLSFDDVGGAVPRTVQLEPSQDMRPASVVASWNGAAASGTFLACLSIYSQNGVLISRTAPPVEFAVGDTGVVTYAPFLGKDQEPEPPADVPGSPAYVILELSGEYNVWRVLALTPTRLTPYTAPPPWLTSDMMMPRQSPNGAWVSFRDQDATSGEDVLRIVPGDGGAVTDVLTMGADRLMHPTWHPDSDGILYCRGLAFAFRGQVEATDRSGAGPTVLYTPAAGQGAYRPQYNFDGTLIAFILYTDIGAPDSLIVMNADGSGVTTVAAMNFYRFDGPQFGWSPTENRLVFDTGNNTVQTVMADGTGLTTISVGDTAAQQNRVSDQCFAPDGSYAIISSRWFDGSAFVYRPYRLELDGSAATRLNNTAGPADVANFRCLYRNVWDDRLYFIDRAGPGLVPGRVASLALDGTGYRIEHTISAGGVGDEFYAGTGFDFV